MQYRHLPSTGLKVSEICLGTMTFGGQTGVEESKNIIAYALDAGINFIDTANIYTKGESERILGEALGFRRSEVILATKTGGPASRIINGSGLSRRQILSSVEDSLKRLNTDYIDILYLHFPDKLTPAEEYIDAVSTLIRSGKVRYWGVSNFATWQCCRLMHLAKEMGAIAPCVTQNVYSLINRGLEDELAPFLQEYKMGLTVFNPLAGGLLTGKHSREHYTEGTRFALEKGYAMRYWNDRNFDAVDMLKFVAEENGMTLVELSYKWLLSQSRVTSVIGGVSKLSQLEEMSLTVRPILFLRKSFNNAKPPGQRFEEIILTIIDKNEKRERRLSSLIIFVNHINFSIFFRQIRQLFIFICFSFVKTLHILKLSLDGACPGTHKIV